MSIFGEHPDGIPQYSDHQYNIQKVRGFELLFEHPNKFIFTDFYRSCIKAKKTMLF